MAATPFERKRPDRPAFTEWFKQAFNRLDDPICCDQLLSTTFKVTVIYCLLGFIWKLLESNSARDNYDPA